MNNFARASGPIDARTHDQSSVGIFLASSGFLLIHVRSPDNIGMDDIGTPCGMTAFTINGRYIVECLV